MLGKAKCKILKEIRRRIAEENEIPFVIRECQYQGSCKGTCPKCEQELRYLEQQLEKRQKLGKAVTVSALSLSLLMGSAACQPKTLQENQQISEIGAETSAHREADETPRESSVAVETVGSETEEIPVLEGDVAYIPEESEHYEIAGLIAETEENAEETDSVDEGQ